MTGKEIKKYITPGLYKLTEINGADLNKICSFNQACPAQDTSIFVAQAFNLNPQKVQLACRLRQVHRHINNLIFRHILLLPNKTRIYQTKPKFNVNTM
jgi:hypothetical protein